MPKTFFRTTAFRLTVIYMVVFALFAIVMVSYISHNANHRLRVQLDQSIEREIVGLFHLFERSGLYGLRRYVDRRSRQPGSAALLVMSPQGVPLEGNIPELPPDFLADNHHKERLHPLPYRRRDINGKIVQHLAMVRILDLPNGFFLIVGRDVGEREEFKRIVFGSVVIALGALLLLGFLSWLMVGRRVLRRLDAVSVTSRSIVAGDLSERLHVDGSGDEFDRLAESVNAMLDRIEALMIGLKDVSDNIAHDLKTPLTRMRNRIDAALSSSAEKDTLRCALEETVVDSDQLIKTFDALLKIARLEAGSSIGQDSEVDLNALIGDVVELYDPVAEEKGAVLSFLPTKEPVRALVNRELISQAVANLIDNAIKYAAFDKTPEINVHLDVLAETIVVSVDDNGPGIPEKDYERVTKRFIRLEESRTDEGSGLGLSLVAAVAKLHGGSLSFASNEPGLRVTLILPKRIASGVTS